MKMPTSDRSRIASPERTATTRKRLSLTRGVTRVSLLGVLAIGAAPVAASGSSRGLVTRCAPDAVVAGSVCVDRYEASVWRVPDPATTNANLIRGIRLGRATRAELLAAGAVRLGAAGDDYAPCGDDGQRCADDIYAVSLPSEIPAANITWFQAEEACANSGKRLLTNAEWQVAANGSPDPGPDDGTTDCNSASRGTVTLTGSRSRCVSARGAFDMVGNLFEWVSDWVPLSTFCPNWGDLSDDVMCLAGASTTGSGPGTVLPGPGAVLRGGSYLGDSTDGPLTVVATVVPSRSDESIGFRCAR